MATAAPKTSDFRVKTSARSLGFNTVQKVGRILALPMFAMGLMVITAGLIVGIVRASDISDAASGAAGGFGGAGALDAAALADAEDIEALRQVQQGLIFAGLASLLAGISFAIARILGQFRDGGGNIQEAAKRTVVTLKRPWTAWGFLMLMMMGMMTVLVAAALHFIYAGDVEATAASLTESADRFAVLAGVERLGIGMLLAGIALGLGTIPFVLRFQAMRVRELPEEAPRGT